MKTLTQTLLVSATVIFFCLGAVAAQEAGSDQIAAPVETVDTKDVAEQNTMSDPKSVRSASDDMDDWFDDVMTRFGFTGPGENNGKFIMTASQTVMLNPLDPQFGDALVNGFEKAMIKVQEQYLMQRFGKTVTEKIQSFYSDRSTDAGEIPLPQAGEEGFMEKVMSLLDKGLDVAGKKLDQELVALGVDPNELANMPPKEQKDLFRNKFLRESMRKAAGSIAGLFPLQTRVIMDDKGRAVVGVVAIASPKTLQIARDIRLERPSLVTGKGRDISGLLPESSQAYLGTMGVRLTYDTDGSPAIVSYGIASYLPDTGDDYINDELKAEARSAAVSLADTQIAEIINGTMSAKSSRKTGEETRKFVERKMIRDADTVERTVKNIIKITQREAKSRASANLQGISTVKTWRYTMEKGQKFVGAVRVWKYSTLAAVKSFDKKPKKRTIKVSAPEKKTHKTFEQTSKAVNSADDF
ncbi:MAG: hypothetical protein MI802_16175 [Desulfobacterales bacterium]|nr:hypothetical protein [Desulfobacterales bacterium]